MFLFYAIAYIIDYHFFFKKIDYQAQALSKKLVARCFLSSWIFMSTLNSTHHCYIIDRREPEHQMLRTWFPTSDFNQSTEIINFILSHWYSVISHPYNLNGPFNQTPLILIFFPVWIRIFHNMLPYHIMLPYHSGVCLYYHFSFGISNYSEYFHRITALILSCLKIYFFLCSQWQCG